MIEFIVQKFNEIAQIDGYTASYKKLELLQPLNEVETNTNLRTSCRV